MCGDRDLIPFGAIRRQHLRSGGSVPRPGARSATPSSVRIDLLRVRKPSRGSLDSGRVRYAHTAFAFTFLISLFRPCPSRFRRRCCRRLVRRLEGHEGLRFVALMLLDDMCRTRRCAPICPLHCLSPPSLRERPAAAAQSACPVHREGIGAIWRGRLPKRSGPRAPRPPQSNSLPPCFATGTRRLGLRRSASACLWRCGASQGAAELVPQCGPSPTPDDGASGPPDIGGL